MLRCVNGSDPGWRIEYGTCQNHQSASFWAQPAHHSPPPYSAPYCSVQSLLSPAGTSLPSVERLLQNLDGELSQHALQYVCKVCTGGAGFLLVQRSIRAGSLFFHGPQPLPSLLGPIPAKSLSFVLSEGDDLLKVSLFECLTP